MKQISSQPNAIPCSMETLGNTTAMASNISSTTTSSFDYDALVTYLVDSQYAYLTIASINILLHATGLTLLQKTFKGSRNVQHLHLINISSIFWLLYAIGRLFCIKFHAENNASTQKLAKSQLMAQTRIAREKFTAQRSQ